MINIFWMAVTLIDCAFDSARLLAGAGVDSVVSKTIGRGSDIRPVENVLLEINLLRLIVH